jgi:hypothetical protein
MARIVEAGAVRFLWIELDHMCYHFLQAGILDAAEKWDRGVVFATAIHVELAQAEDGRLDEELGDDTSRPEDIHGPGELGIRIKLLAGRVEPLGRQIACSSSSSGEVVREIGGVVIRQHDWLEGGRKVGEIEPVP